MVRILFVCLGNICRSAMAECVMSDLVAHNGLTGKIEVDSAGTSSWEVGNEMYGPAKKKMREYGVPLLGHVARKITPSDYVRFDLIIYMDKSNLSAMRKIIGEDAQRKTHMLLEFCDNPHEVADPWYTGDFETAYQDISAGCKSLLDYVIAVYDL